MAFRYRRDCILRIAGKAFLITEQEKSSYFTFAIIRNPQSCISILVQNHALPIEVKIRESQPPAKGWQIIY